MPVKMLLDMDAVGGLAPTGTGFAPAVGFGPSHTSGSDAMTANFGATAFANAAPAGFGNWPGAPATFDNGTLLNATLSGGNLIATSASVADGGARNVNYQNTGAYYFELKFNPVVAGSQDVGGLITASGTYNDLIINGTNCSAVVVNLGTIFSNNTNTGKAVGPIVALDVIGVAVNFTTRKAWFRRNAGNWNGDALADPAAGVGGVTIAP